MKKIKNFIVALLLLTTMNVVVGCGGDKKTEDTKAPEMVEKTEKVDAGITTTPETTKTPEKTEEEELPSVEELFEAIADDMNDFISVKMSFAYSGTEYGDPEYGDLSSEMRMGTEMRKSGNIEHTYMSVNLTASGENFTSITDEYILDTPEIGVRTKYSRANGGDWSVIVTEYFPSDADVVGNNTTTMDGITNVKVSADEKNYYIDAILTEEQAEDLISSFEIFEPVESSCRFAIAKEDKKFLSCNIVVKLKSNDTEDVHVVAEDFKIEVRKLTEAIVIPEDALNTELESEDDKHDEQKTSDWKQKYYSEYTSNVGTFLMWDNKELDGIEITLNGKDNWYFDSEYTYSAFGIIEDSNISQSSPAYTMNYSDSGEPSGNAERAAIHLLSQDYTKEKNMKDIVPFVCLGKQGYYLVIHSNDYNKEIVILQDIGFDNYVKINVTTKNVTLTDLELVEMFMVNYQ